MAKDSAITRERIAEAEPLIRTNMILGIVFAEAISIYALVVALLIKFVA